MKNNNNINNQNSNNYELDLNEMTGQQLVYLDKLLKQNEELKKLYAQEVYSNNRNRSAVEIYDEIFPSVTAAAESLGLDRALIYYRIRKPEFDGHFVKLNRFGEVVERSKVPPKSKKKQDQSEDDQE